MEYASSPVAQPATHTRISSSPLLPSTSFAGTWRARTS